MSSYRISVIIPTYQRCASVERALRALSRQSLSPADYEVIVSINGSQDATSEMVDRFEAPYELHSTYRPKPGRAAACNAGICAARGELLVLLDDDMEPAPEFLAAHVRAHRGEPRLGVIGAVPVTVEPGSPPVADYLARKFRRHMKKLEDPQHRFDVRDFYTGNFSLPREIFFEVGLFDETFQVYGNEDVELAIRLEAAGVRLMYSPEALARQYCEKDFEALARDKIAQGRTSVTCAVRHPEVVPRLRVGTYRDGSRKWRLIRRGLLVASRLLPFVPNWVIRYIQWLEHHHARTLQRRYFLALDYFFWLGVLAALQENPSAIGSSSDARGQ